MEQSIMYEKALEAAQEAYRLASDIQKKQKEFLLSQQLLQSVLNVGITLHLSQTFHYAQTLSMKLYIARKQCAQALFFCTVVQKVALHSEDDILLLSQEITEILKMIQASLTTIQKNKTARNKATKAKQQDV